MPLPTAAELTDPNATNTQMKQRLGQLAENVESKESSTEKANTAKDEAILAASTDATTKANAAEANAKAYTDNKFIFNKNLLGSYTEGSIVNHQNATISALAGYAYTDYIAVNPGDIIEVANGRISSLAAFYNDSNTWISGQAGTAVGQPIKPYTFVVPANAKFMRVNINLSATPINSFYVYKNPVSVEKGRVQVKDLQVPKTQIDGFVDLSLNLFNPMEVSTTTIVNTLDGSFVANTNFPTIGRTGYMEVLPDFDYEFNFNDATTLMAEYDQNKTFVKGHNGRQGFTLRTQPNTKYVVSNILLADAENYVFKAIGEGYSLKWLEERLKSVTTLNRFKDKKLLVSGDSITEVNNRASKNWHAYLKDWLGIVQVQNDAVSGSGLIKSGNTVGMNYRLADWQTKYETPDLILLMGNMNDGTSGATGAWDWIYGTADAHKGDFTTVVDNTNMASSLWYALRYLFETLITKYPNVPIGFIISQPRAQVAVKSGTARNGYTTTCWGDNGWFAEWVEVIERLAGHYSIPTLNLYTQSNMRPWNAVNNATYFSNATTPEGDGIHPNALGQELMANKILEFTKQFV